MSEYHDEKELAWRTKVNLEYIERQHNNEIFEVTQLINSTLGMLVFPKEKLYKVIPENFLGDDDFMLDYIKSTYADKYGTLEPRTAKTLLRHLRNSVTHFMFEPQSENGIISHFLFRDKSTTWGKYKGNFSIRLSVNELRNFLFRFFDVIKTLN